MSVDLEEKLSARPDICPTCKMAVLCEHGQPLNEKCDDCEAPISCSRREINDPGPLFKAWKALLPKCLSYEGGCDGDLVGMLHIENCPMFGQRFATHEDAFFAGFYAGLTANPKAKRATALGRAEAIEMAEKVVLEIRRRVEREPCPDSRCELLEESEKAIRNLKEKG